MTRDILQAQKRIYGLRKFMLAQSSPKHAQWEIKVHSYLAYLPLISVAPISGRVSFFTREVLTELHGSSAINPWFSLPSKYDGNLRFEEITAGVTFHVRTTLPRFFLCAGARRFGRALGRARRPSGSWPWHWESVRCVGSREGLFLHASFCDCWRRPVSLLLSTSLYPRVA